jgi:hypothetical protein
MDNIFNDMSNLTNSNKELDKIDKTLERKIKYNKKYVKLLELLMKNTIDNFHIVVKNLDES